MGWGRRLLLIALLTCLSTLADNPLPWSNFVEAFKLLDEDGKELPAKIPNFSSSPFGTLIYWNASGEVGLCSATHVSKARLLTAAHCLKNGRDPANYIAIFFDKQGKKRGVRVKQIPYVGDERLDVALIELEPGEAESWEVLNGGIRRYEKRSIASKVPEFEGVKAWSYTPLSSMPRHAEKFPGSIGMVFRPNRCTASRTIPHLEVFTAKTKAQERRKVYEFYFKKEKVTDENIHLFLDECDYPVVQGNSGSLITAGSDPKLKIGVLHLFVADKAKIWSDIEKHNENRAELEYYYSGNDGRARKFAWGYGDFLIASGTALEALPEIALKAGGLF